MLFEDALNRLSTEKRFQVVAALMEGSSINSIVRMTGVAKYTILNLLENMGCACAAYHHHNVRYLRIRRLQCDEIWAFVGAKQKNVSPEKKAEGRGDAWTWTAIDADTKLCVSALKSRPPLREASGSCGVDSLMAERRACDPSASVRLRVHAPHL